ncbi:MAG: ATP-binding protein [Planctomycetota bacterium]|nr:ATP-binding protein [Planctomycetota bacterium]
MELALKHNPVSVLLIDADHKNAERVERMLSVARGAMEVRGGLFSVTRVDDILAAVNLVETQTFGAVFLNLNVPDCCGPDPGQANSQEPKTLDQIRWLAVTLPVIVLTDVDDEGMALAAIKAGAQDWLPKQDLGRNLLTRTIRHAIERKRAEVKLLRHTREVEAARARIEQQAEEINARAEQLDKMNRDLDDFAYIASHDLKEPLRGIAAYCQILIEDYHDRLDDDGRRRLTSLETLCERLERLIDNLLTYCRVGRVHTPEAKVDLNKIVAEQLETFRAGANEREVFISVADNLPIVKGDASLIGMVLANLISNALKYNASGRPRVEIGATKGKNPSIFVKDNGIGIEKKYHEDVFGLFRRLHTRKEYEGTGAGLTIVRKIVESHGGRIWLKSEPGAGSTFFVSLPPADVKQVGETQVKSPPHFSLAAPSLAQSVLGD